MLLPAQNIASKFRGGNASSRTPPPTHTCSAQPSRSPEPEPAPIEVQSVRLKQRAPQRMPVRREPSPTLVTWPSGQPAGRSLQCNIMVPMTEPMVGRRLVLVGSAKQLGAWDLKRGLLLVGGTDQIWRGELQLTPGEVVEAKLVVMEADGQCRWEPGANRQLPLPLAPDPSSARLVIMIHYGIALCSHMMFLNKTSTWAEGAAAPSSPPTSTSCHVSVPHYMATPGQQLLLVGSLPELGGWEAGQGLRLTPLPGHVWEGRVQLPIKAAGQAKLVVMDPDGSLSWEPGPSRQFDLAQGSPDPPDPAASGATSLMVAYWGNPGCTPCLTLPVYPACPLVRRGRQRRCLASCCLAWPGRCPECLGL
ncbi:hypothetical protein V8C86DRAFT_1176415 [Haematococcus lacustris]